MTRGVCGHDGCDNGAGRCARGVLIGAPSSGSGKTTVSRGLMSLLRRRGLRVAPFKCGPDYIDTKYHEAAAGRGSVNLDLFMASREHVRELYARYSHDADVAVAEGMMGLFDGYERYHGSAADVAMTIGLPVVMVVDARSTGYSVAPLLKGFAGFDPRLTVGGVIFNRVGSARHATMMREAAEDAGIPCLGCIPRCSDIEQASRYLGLDFSRSKVEEGIALAADMVERYVDVDALMAVAQKPLCGLAGLSAVSPVPDVPAVPYDGERIIAVARNEESFSFIYKEHLDMLEQIGKVVFFDPEDNRPIPDGTWLLYLPGGYPERHAEALANAVECRRSIADHISRGGLALAECGGMMYLSRGIICDDDGGGHPEGVTWPMAGVLPFTITARKSDRRLSLGYRSLTLDGATARGHEFHYTRLAGPSPLESAAVVADARGNGVDSPLYRYKGLLASYTHLYWPSGDVFANHIISQII